MWDCDTCGGPWPCDPARKRLRAEGCGPSLAILMWAYLEDAVLELPGMPAGEAFDRFIAWTRPENETDVGSKLINQGSGLGPGRGGR